MLVPSFVFQVISPCTTGKKQSKESHRLVKGPQGHRRKQSPVSSSINKIYLSIHLSNITKLEFPLVNITGSLTLRLRPRTYPCVCPCGRLKTESIKKLSNQWTKILYQNNLKYTAFFFKLFKSYRRNKLSVITPKTIFYGSP